MFDKNSCGNFFSASLLSVWLPSSFYLFFNFLVCLFGLPARQLHRLNFGEGGAPSVSTDGICKICNFL